MPDADIVIRARLEDTVAAGLAQTERAVEQFRRNAAGRLVSAQTGRYIAASEAQAVRDAERVERAAQDAAARQRRAAPAVGQTSTGTFAWTTPAQEAAHVAAAVNAERTVQAAVARQRRAAPQAQPGVVLALPTATDVGRATQEATRLERVIQEAAERQRRTRTGTGFVARQRWAAPTRLPTAAERADPESPYYDPAADMALVEQQYFAQQTVSKQRQALLDRAKQLRQQQREERDIALATGQAPPGQAGRMAGGIRGLSMAYAGKREMFGMLGGLGLDPQTAMAAERLMLLGGGGQMFGQVAMFSSLRDLAGGLATKIGPATLAVGGLAAGVGLLAVGAVKTGIDLGELALKFDTVREKGQGAKTSIEQAADATQRLQLGLGRITAPAVDFFNTQKAAALSYVAQQIGRQTPDEQVANAQANARAVQQRLEAARKFWQNQPAAAQAQAAQAPPQSYFQQALGGFGNQVNPQAMIGTLAQREAEARQAQQDLINASLQRAITYQQQFGTIGGAPKMETGQTWQLVNQQLQEQQQLVAGIKGEMADYQATLERVRVTALEAFQGDPEAMARLQRLDEEIKYTNLTAMKGVLDDAEVKLKALTAQEWELRIAVRREGYGRDISVIKEQELGGRLPDIAAGRVTEQQDYIARLQQQIANYNALVQRVGEPEAARLSPVSIEQFRAELKTAERELLDLQATEYLVKINVALTLPNAEQIQARVQQALTPTGQTDLSKWLGLQQQFQTSPFLQMLPPGAAAQALTGMPGGLGFDIAAAPVEQGLGYLRYREEQGTANQRLNIDRILAQPAAPRGPTGPSAMERRLQGLIAGGPQTAVGLGDLRGGTYGGGPTAPGAGGPFEALFRIQDIAIRGDQPGGDTRKWMEMYGLDQERAKSVSKQFQMGVFSPEVMKYVDTQQLVDLAGMMELADKSQEALAAELAKKGAKPENIKKLLGVTSADGKGTDQYKPAINAILGGMDTELGNNKAAVEGLGKKFWASIEKGLTDGAKDSDALLNALRQLIRAELDNSVPEQP